MANTENNSITKVVVDTSAATKQINDLTNKIEELTSSQKELENQGKENTKEYNKQKKEIKDLTSEKAAFEKANNSENLSLNQLKAQLSALNKQYHRLSEEERATAKTTSILTKEEEDLKTAISSLNIEIRKQAKELGNNRELVGSYAEELSGVADQLGNIGSVLNSQTSVVDGISSSLSSIAGSFGKTGAVVAVAGGALLTFASNTSFASEIIKDADNAIKSLNLSVSQKSGSTLSSDQLDRTTKVVSEYVRLRDVIEDDLDRDVKLTQKQLAIAEDTLKPIKERIEASEEMFNLATVSIQKIEDTYSEVVSLQAKLVENTDKNTQAYVEQSEILSRAQKEYADRQEESIDLRNQATKNYGALLEEVAANEFNNYQKYVTEVENSIKDLGLSQIETDKLVLEAKRKGEKAYFEEKIKREKERIAAESTLIDLQIQNTNLRTRGRVDNNLIKEIKDIENSAQLQKINLEELLRKKTITQVEYNQAVNLVDDNTRLLIDNLYSTSYGVLTFSETLKSLKIVISDTVNLVSGWLSISNNSKLRKQQDELAQAQEELAQAQERGSKSAQQQAEAEIQAIEDEIEANREKQENYRQTIAITKAVSSTFELFNKILSKNGLIVRGLVGLFGVEPISRVRKSLGISTATGIIPETTKNQKINTKEVNDSKNAISGQTQAVVYNTIALNEETASLQANTLAQRNNTAARGVGIGGDIGFTDAGVGGGLVGGNIAGQSAGPQSVSPQSVTGVEVAILESNARLLNQISNLKIYTNITDINKANGVINQISNLSSIKK